MCPNLQGWVASLQAPLKVKELPAVVELRSLVARVWTYVLDHNTLLFLEQDLDAYHLMVVWSAKYVGYALFSGPLVNLC